MKWSELIAERTIFLGGAAQGTARSAAVRSTLVECASIPRSAPEHVLAIATALTTLGKQLRQSAPQANQLGDPGTAGLFLEISGDLDKWIGLLKGQSPDRHQSVITISGHSSAPQSLPLQAQVFCQDSFARAADSGSSIDLAEDSTGSAVKRVYEEQTGAWVVRDSEPWWHKPSCLETDMNARHFAVWIGHNDATIFQIRPQGFGKSTVKALHHELTRKAQEQNRHAGSDLFFHGVAQAIKGAAEILILGTHSAKRAFMRHVHKRDHQLEPMILGLRTMNHPTDSQLAAFVRAFFLYQDRRRLLGD